MLLDVIMPDEAKKMLRLVRNACGIEEKIVNLRPISARKVRNRLN